MKTKLAIGVLAALLLCAIAGSEPTAAAKDAMKNAPEKVLRHVVLFKFKDGTTPEQIKKVEDAFRALPSKIDTIRDFEWGTDISTEKLAQGFTHCFLVTFASEADRDAYLPHPAHKEFAGSLGPVLDKVLVVDYWAKK